MLDDAWDLAAGNLQSCEALQSLGSLVKRRVHSARPTHELRHGWSILIVQVELFVERVAASLRTDIVSTPQSDGADKRDDLALSPGMELLVLPALSRRQKLRQLVVEKGFQDCGGIFLGSGPQRLLEPHRIEGLFADELLAGHVQELCDLPAAGRLYDLGFFLLSVSWAQALSSIKSNNLSKTACA